MTEIEKLYENAGCKLDCCKYAEYGYEGEEGTWYYCKKEDKECWTYPNGDADCVEKGYPPFTAEKQISLIKLLAYKEDTGLLINIQAKDDVDIDDPEYFEECLAQLINELWQNLKDYEKDRIKEILNG